MTVLRLPLVSKDTAEAAWDVCAGGGAPDISADEVEYLSDDNHTSFSDIEAEPIFEELERIRASHEFVTAKNASVIDAEIILPIHSTINESAHIREISHAGFWMWLSNVALEGKFWHFINWRFDSSTNQENWGINSSGALLEGYLSRAWLRGSLMYDESLDDPYMYAKRGTTELWRSHILRQDFGRDKEFTKAFIDTVYDSDNRTKVSLQPLRQQLIPAIRAWSSKASFSHLSYDESRELLEKFVENFE